MSASSSSPYLQVIYKTNPLNQLVELLKSHPAQTLISCLTDSRAETLRNQLSEHMSTLRFRPENQKSIQVSGPLSLTKDNSPKPQLLIHTTLPASIKTYLLQVEQLNKGRVILLYHPGDLNQHIRQGTNPENPDLRAMIRYAETGDCRLNTLLSLAGRKPQSTPCNHCDNCIHEEKNEIHSKDLTQPAQMILSCILRTGRRFGGRYLIDVLRGVPTKRIRQNEHDQLPTFGIGNKRSVPEWWKIVNLLSERDFIQRKMPYRNFVVTAKGLQWLKNREKLIFTEEPVPKKRSKSQKKADLPLDYDEQLYDKLRHVRRELAQNEDVPAYVIFNNRTLKHMAARYPQKIETLNEIPGVGWEKLNRYGERFLKTIRHHCKQLRMNGPHYH